MTCDLHTGCARHHLPPLVARFSGPHLGAGARGHQRLRRRGDDFALPCAVGRSAFRRKPPLRPSLLSRLCWCVHTAQCWWASNVVAIQSSCTEHSVTKRSGVKKRPTIEAKETYCRGKRDLPLDRKHVFKNTQHPPSSGPSGVRAPGSARRGFRCPEKCLQK